MTTISHGEATQMFDVLRAAEESADRTRTVNASVIWTGRTVLVIALLAFWEFVAGHLMDPAFISRPSAIAEAWWSVAASGILWENTRVTVFEVLCGFFAGALIGIGGRMFPHRERRGVSCLRTVCDHHL